MSIFPPGVAFDPNAPWNQGEGPCDVCGLSEDDCICPECPECGAYGDAHCYLHHELVISDEQRASKERAEREASERDRLMIEEADRFYVGRIVKALRCAAHAGNCPQPVCDEKCEYWSGYDIYEERREWANAAADLIERLSDEVDMWKRLAEALERDIKKPGSCVTCKNQFLEETADMPCNNCFNGWFGINYEWRGPCAENGGEA